MLDSLWCLGETSDITILWVRDIVEESLKKFISLKSLGGELGSDDFVYIDLNGVIDDFTIL